MHLKAYLENGHIVLSAKNDHNLFCSFSFGFGVGVEFPTSSTTYKRSDDFKNSVSSEKVATKCPEGGSRNHKKAQTLFRIRLCSELVLPSLSVPLFGADKGSLFP